MRFLVDECTGPKIARWLQAQHHDVLSAFDEIRGAPDTEVIQRAHRENRILITNDKDFGEKVYREGHEHHGVILLRLEDERLASKQKVLRRLLETHATQLRDRFVVVTETAVRFGE